jgi:hypothetical protein
MKIDFRTARMRTHRRNIQRYGRLLATELTDLERQYLHRRIAEEQAELEQLARKDDPSTHGGVSARPVKRGMASSANSSRDGSP